MQDRVPSKYDLLEAIQTEGVPGVFRVVYLMIDPDGISADCLVEADNAFDSASTAEDVWDACIDMARCLQDAKFDETEPEEPEPQPDPDPVPDPDFGADKGDTVGVLVLAALLVQLRGQSKTWTRTPKPSAKGQ